MVFAEAKIVEMCFIKIKENKATACQHSISINFINELIECRSHTLPLVPAVLLLVETRVLKPEGA